MYWLLQQKMRSTYAYSDTQVFGEYPAYLLSYFKNNNINIVKEADDDRIMKEYPVDFISFSYYMSSCEAADKTGLDVTPGNTILAVKNHIWKQANGVGKLIHWD